MMITCQMLLFFLLSFHPVHVSVTSMEYNKAEQVFLVSFKVFTDDFEKGFIFDKKKTKIQMFLI